MRRISIKMITLRRFIAICSTSRRKTKFCLEEMYNYFVKTFSELKIDKLLMQIDSLNFSLQMTKLICVCKILTTSIQAKHLSSQNLKNHTHQVCFLLILKNLKLLQRLQSTHGCCYQFKKMKSMVYISGCTEEIK